MNDSIVATLMADSWVHPAMAPNDNYPGFVDVESLANYTLGGYCPINIDDRFRNGSDIYTIIHKLGFGRASTVWLAKREKLNTGNISFHALKILRADFSTQDTYAEYTTLWYLEQLNRESHPGLVHVQDRFHISSANGKHHCFVLPFLGPSLCDRRVLDAMSRETRQSVCEQLAHAVNYIHASDVCHAGEF
jgi:serine/threonine protein kinase